MTATDKPKAPGLLDGRFSPTRPLAASGNLFAFFLDVVRSLPKRPFQIREFMQQAWFIASVTIMPDGAGRDPLRRGHRPAARAR